MRYSEIRPDLIVKNLDRLIGDSFDEDDRDSGTSGFCGTFALILHYVLKRYGVPSQLVFVCVPPPPNKNTETYWWRHALVEVDGSYYDVDGKVEPEHVISNYCWGSINCEGFLKPVSENEFIKEIRSVKSACSLTQLMAWKQKLEAGITSLSQANF